MVDGEEALSRLAGWLWDGVPVQRCLFHLARAVGWLARYRDRLPGETADDLVARLDALLSAAYRTGDLAAAVQAYDDLIDPINQHSLSFSWRLAPPPLRMRMGVPPQDLVLL